MKKYIFIILTLFCQSMSVVFGKYASISIEKYDLSNIAVNKYYYLSLLCLFFQSLFWQFTLKKYKLSTAYIFMSLVYIIILIFSYIIFKENVTIKNIAGSIIIIIGIMICITEKEKTKNSGIEK